MKLYFSKGACSLAVRIALHETNTPSEFESVDLKTKKTASGEDFYKINPKGAVPALRLDDNSVLTENSALHQYLADMAKATNLLPAIPDIKRYRVLEWLGYVNSEVHKGYGPLFSGEVPEEMKEKIFRPSLMKKFEFLNKHLEKNKFLMGNDYTLPDGYLFTVLRWAHAVKMDLKTVPHLERYMSDVKGRKSVQQALQEEGLS